MKSSRSRASPTPTAHPGGNGPTTCSGKKDDTFLKYSNFGKDVDIAAPGDCILSLLINGGLAEISGTSEASPARRRRGGGLHRQLRRRERRTPHTRADEDLAPERRVALSGRGRRQAGPDKHKKHDKKRKKGKGKHGGKHKHKNKKKGKDKKVKRKEPVLWLDLLA